MATLASLSDINSTVPSAPAGASTTSCGSWSLKDQLTQRGLWIFIIVAVVVLVVIMYISKSGMKKDDEGQSWWDTLSMYSWGKSTSLWGVIMVLGVLLFAWAAFTAYNTVVDKNKRNMIIGGFGLSMLALVAMFSVFFRKDADGNNSTSGFSTASWVAIFAAVVGFGALYPMWSVPAARIAMVPYLVWIVAVVILLWDMDRRRENKSD